MTKPKKYKLHFISKLFVPSCSEEYFCQFSSIFSGILQFTTGKFRKQNVNIFGRPVQWCTFKIKRKNDFLHGKICNTILSGIYYYLLCVNKRPKK